MLYALHKNWTFIAFALLSILSIIFGFYFHQYLLFGIPIIVLGFLAAIMDLRIIYLLLLASLPLAIEHNFTPGLGIDLVSEPMMLIVTGLFFILIFRNPTIIDFNLLKHPIFFLIILQWIWAICCIPSSHNTVASIKFILAKIWYVIPFCVVTYHLIKTKEDLKPYFWAIHIPLLLLVLRALSMHAGMGFSFELVNKTIKPFFRNHVSYAVMLALFIPFVWYMRQYYTPHSIRRGILNFSLIICIIATYFSYTRAAVLSLLLALIALFILYKRLLIPALIISVMGAICLGKYLIADNRYLRLAPDFNKTIYHDDVMEHLASTLNLEDVSAAERIYRWIAGLRMINENPIFGFGPTTFAYQYKPYTVTEFTTWVSDNDDNSTVHNYPLLILIEQGYIGLLLLIIFWIYLLLYCQKLFHQSRSNDNKRMVLLCFLVIVIMFVNNMFSDMFEVDKTGSIFLIAITLLIRASDTIKSESLT